MEKKRLVLSRMSWLVRVFFVVLLASALAASVWASEKKGVGLALGEPPERINILNVAWYYTWQPQPLAGVPSEKFVPMLRSRGGRVLDEQIRYFRSMGKVAVLLALNEPNRKMGDNMSVEQVIRIWPQISALADRVSSPAPAGVLGPWFDRFYRMAKARGLKYDFIAAHRYGPPDPQDFLNRIDLVYQKYGMPIWITEFAVADWDAVGKPMTNRYTEEQVLAFMRAVLPELEKRPYVQRYAWFGAGKAYFAKGREELRTSRLFEHDGTFTRLGRYYAEFSWPRAPARRKDYREPAEVTR